MHKNNFRRRQRRIENRLGETVRIASIVQKGMATGRSSYVEMRALERLTHHNIRTKIQAIKSSAGAKDDVAEVLSRILAAVHGGYVDILTPNGVVREKELDHLLSIDSEIATCLGVIGSQLKSQSKSREVGEILKELVEERIRLIESLKA